MMVSMPDMSSTAFIEALPVIDFVAQILGKDVMSRPLSDANRIKVSFAVGNKESGVVLQCGMPCSSCYLLVIGYGLLACL